VRRARNSETGQLERLFGDAGKVGELLAAGDECLVAVSSGRLEAAEWIRWGPAEYRRDEARLGVVFELPCGQAWLHNGLNRDETAKGPWGMVMGRLRERFWHARRRRI